MLKQVEMGFFISYLNFKSITSSLSSILPLIYLLSVFKMDKEMFQV